MDNAGKERMSQENIEPFAPAAFRAKLEKTIAAKTVGDSEFADVVYTAVSSFGIDETRFRNAFGLTKDAVERWTQLRNLPQPLVRIKIMEWIIKNL